MEPASSSSAAVRVLIRHSPPPPASSPSPPPQNQTTPSPPPGVVVVGFLGSGDTAHLINRILDANVFGSGNLDKDLVPSLSETGFSKDWFERRRISYHHDEEKGVVFLHFSRSSDSLGLDGKGCDGLASVLEQREADDLRGMLFMFSVCHVIIYLHEGMRFDTTILKKLRMLQTAKHALGPFLRSQISPNIAPKPVSTVSQPTTSKVSSVSQHGRRVGAAIRHSSAISVMSGSVSHPSVLPGQCTPVILFVFRDDFSDSTGPASTGEDSTDASLVNHPSSSLSGIPKAGLTLKGTGSVLMLARPTNKAEASFRKKLQSSLEAQIRFLIKKCRILIGSDSSHLGLRGAASLGSPPLFSVDSSRVVALLDRTISYRGESLDFITSLIEEAYDSKSTVDLLMLENHCQNVNHEDIQLIKDFVYRQCDALRGRGGLPGNANSGSVAGVGMVAAAAAAAAASAAAGKLVNAPELPSLGNWLSLSSLILEGLLSVQHDSDDGNERPSPQKAAVEAQEEKSGYSAIRAAISLLESSKDLNMKFSLSWCQRALPAAREVYLKDLPACYPTALHKTQLDKSLRTFRSMVKGAAVEMFAKSLEQECTSIWESGRQLCDAVSLTGKPCMHQRHTVKSINSPAEAAVKEHCSGFVFLHACACGRSRRIREDPFDFESANVIFNCFDNCEDILPTLIVPKGTNTGPLLHNSWNLVRLGGAKYYKPIKGLLQIGFFSDEKLLLKWTISLEKQNGLTGSDIGVSSKTDVNIGVPSKIDVRKADPDPKVEPVFDKEKRKPDVANVPKVHLGESETKSSELMSFGNQTISFGKGFPSFSIKKPFSEVVAGTNVVNSTHSNHQQKRQPKISPEKVLQQMSTGDQHDNQGHITDDRQGSERTTSKIVQECSGKFGSDGHMNGDPVLQIGSNIVPVKLSGAGQIKPVNSLKQVVIYIGFEHECPYGHRFLLSPKHVSGLDSLYNKAANGSHSSTEESDRNFTESQNISIERIPLYSSGTDTTHHLRKTKITPEPMVNHSLQHEVSKLSAKSGMEISDSLKEIEGNLLHVRLDDGGSAFSFLNRNLPLYMKCPHCKDSKKDDNQKTRFASTISQLQRIFLVTPPFPVVLATCPIIQFQDSCLPESVMDREQQSRFSLGCPVILPPESFLTLRLPFVYGVQTSNGNWHPLNPMEDQPDLTAWLVKGTALQVVSRAHVSNEVHMQ